MPFVGCSVVAEPDVPVIVTRTVQPEAVTVTEREDGESTVLELHVAPEDMGKVIGRQGRIAKEIRTVVRSYAQRTGQKVSVEIVD